MRLTEYSDQIWTQLQEIIGQLTCQIAPAPLPTPEVMPTFPMPLIGAGSKLAPPARYAGEPEQSRIFLIDCSIHYELNPLAFPTERSKVAFIFPHLTGRAKTCAAAEWGRGTPICLSLTDFQAALTELTGTFDPVTMSREKAQDLSRLKQGSGSVCDYAMLL